MRGPTRQQIPNLVTITRLILAGAFFLVLNQFRAPDQHPQWVLAAMFLFIVAAATDAVDGYLARRWNAVSAFGRIMDPFVDKVLVLGAFVYLASDRFTDPARLADGETFTMLSGVYPWMVVVVMARELLVTAIRGLAEREGIAFGARTAGKLKMVLQSIAIPVILLVLAVGAPTERPAMLLLNHLLAVATIIVTIWSGVPYIIGIRRLADIARPTTGPPA